MKFCQIGLIFLPNLPNSNKIKNPLNISKLNILNFISFWNVLPGVKSKTFIKIWQICQIRLKKLDYLRLYQSSDLRIDSLPKAVGDLVGKSRLS